MKIIHQIKEKAGRADALEALEAKFSGSELNTYLLYLFQQRAKKVKPADLLHQFEHNRFVQTAEIDTLAFKALELEWLQHAEQNGFRPVTLSPLAPLGCCSVVGEVNQNNVVSATRGTEVVSDATNVLALKIAEEQKSISKKEKLIKYATTHRHVRGQTFDHPAFTAHFGVFCLVSGGLDSGSFAFELSQLWEHLNLHYTLLSQKFGVENLLVKFFLKDRQHPFHPFLEEKLKALPFASELIHQQDSGDYYKLIQFKVYLKKQQMEVDLADGGLVDWTQKLLSNKKHRLFISGCGLELVHKFLKHDLHQENNNTQPFFPGSL